MANFVSSWSSTNEIHEQTVGLVGTGKLEAGL